MGAGVSIRSKGPVFFLQLNEVNFDYLQAYSARGLLPNFARFLEEHGHALTTSEERYEHLEPWIQWVSAHTGLSFSEHRVFRLGDITRTEIPQIWDILSENGVRIGAVCPMNAANRTPDAAFFVPDPWTETPITGSPLVRGMYRAISQAVNDNASGRLTPGSASWLVAGTLAYARMKNFSRYRQLIKRSRTRHWARALVLDLLLSDLFIGLTRRKKPGFASLFLNAAAHIQHHYLFNCAAYSGPTRNPSWYVAEDEDPVFEAYELYDHILGYIRQLWPEARIILATGLHQAPYPDTSFYWRLVDHATFLQKLDIPFCAVEPRMSRDFLVVCGNENEAAQVASRLENTVSANDGERLFEVDNRGKDLFVTLTYSRDINETFAIRSGNRVIENFRSFVAFVAIKNGQHNGNGYFSDSHAPVGPQHPTMPITEIPSRLLWAMGIEPEIRKAGSVREHLAQESTVKKRG